MSLIYNEGFFAKKVMLIEGSSDMILCRYLCNRLNLNLDVAGSQIIPVEGKGQFPVITKLFRLIGKDVCVLTDLDGFTDDNNVINLFSSLPEATEIANNHGNDDLQTMVRDIKTKIDELIRTHKTNMRDIYEKHPYWINRDPEADEEKIVTVLFGIAGKGEDHLQLVQQIALFCSDIDNVVELAAALDKEEIAQSLTVA